MRLEKKESNVKISFRDYNSIHFPSLYNNLAAIDWMQCFWYPCVEDKVDFFVQNLQNLFDQHVPLKSFTVNSSSCPWFTQRVKKCLKEKNKAYAKWKRTLSRADWDAYKVLRNRASLIARQEKKKVFNKKLNPSQDPKALWRNIRQLNVHKKSHSVCNLDPNDLNTYFTPSSTSGFSCTNNSEADVCTRRFKFFPIAEEDVTRCVLKIKTNAIGEDGIPAKFIKMILPFILAPLTHIINSCLTFSIFPSMWKNAVIIPVPKKEPAIDLSDYRPKAILPCLSKVLKMIMAE